MHVYTFMFLACAHVEALGGLTIFGNLTLLNILNDRSHEVPVAGTAHTYDITAFCAEERFFTCISQCQNTTSVVLIITKICH